MLNRGSGSPRDLKAALSKLEQQEPQSAMSRHGNESVELVQICRLSENSVPLHPMVNDHYPY